MTSGKHPRLGFIGTGGIVEAIIIGLYEFGGYNSPIRTSERSRHRSKKLQDRFEQIQVESDNQSIVDQSDWVFAGVLPEQTIDLLGSLQFRADQKIISLAAGIELATIENLVKPASSFLRLIPMPPIEFGVGPVVVCPPDAAVERLFDRIGTSVSVTDEAQFSAFSASSAVMASYFELTASMARWLEKQQVPKASAAQYSTSILHALSCMTTKVDASELQSMSRDCLTIGGLNEQVLNELSQENWFVQLESKWDRILQRLKN